MREQLLELLFPGVGRGAVVEAVGELRVREGCLEPYGALVARHHAQLGFAGDAPHLPECDALGAQAVPEEFPAGCARPGSVASVTICRAPVPSMHSNADESGKLRVRRTSSSRPTVRGTRKRAMTRVNAGASPACPASESGPVATARSSPTGHHSRPHITRRSDDPRGNGPRLPQGLRGRSSQPLRETPGRAARADQSRSGVLMPSRAMPWRRVRAVTSQRNRRFSTCSGVSAFSTGHLS